MNPKDKNASSKRLNREQWLDKALNILAREGKAQLRIDRLKQARDPLRFQAARLAPWLRDEVEEGVAREIQAAYRQALEDPLPDTSALRESRRTWS